jgi:hypothetical protein
MLKQRKPMSRGQGFKRPEWVKPEPAPLRPATRQASYAGTTGDPIAKGVKAKPGKRAPTVEERAWMDWIVAYGCVACRLDGLGFRSPAVHHILRGGQRLGHLHTLPLCDPGHHQGGQQLEMISRHPWKARFEERYGSEESLLLKLQAERATASGSSGPAGPADGG